MSAAHGRLASGEQKPRLDSLTSLRFFAALAVFLDHFGFTVAFSKARFQNHYMSWVHNAGMLGVSFFFILSGFVLAWSVRRSDTVALFWRRRLFKIFPLHLVTLVGTLVVYTWFATAWSHDSWDATLLNLFQVQTWWPRDDFMFILNIPSWTLSCELAFYLAFPLLHRWIMKIRPEHLWRWACGVIAAILAVPAAAALLPGKPTMTLVGAPLGPQVSRDQLWFVNSFPPVRMLEFVLGILLARIVLSDRWIGVRLAPALGLTVGAYALSLHLPWRYGFVAGTIIPLALVIPAAAVADTRRRGRVLRNPVLVWLGEVSFAFYLVHLLGMWGVGKMFPRSAPPGTSRTLALMVVEFAFALLLAAALHHLVERPVMRRWSMPASSRRSLVVATGPATAAPEKTPAAAAGERAGAREPLVVEERWGIDEREDADERVAAQEPVGSAGPQGLSRP